MTAVRHVNANPNILNSFKKLKLVNKSTMPWKVPNLAKQEASAPGFL